MVTVLEHEFFLSEILDRRVFAKTKRIGRLSDLAIVETGKLPEVTQVVVDRPYGYPALTIPWDKVLLISNHEVVLDVADESLAQYERAPQEHLILLHDHILDKKIIDMDDHDVEVVYDVKLAFQNDKLYAAEVDYSRYRALRRLGLLNCRASRHEKLSTNRCMRSDARFRLLRNQPGIGPDDADNRYVDLWKDVHRCPQQHHWGHQEQQQGQHDKCVGSVEVKSDNPYGNPLKSEISRDTMARNWAVGVVLNARAA